MPNGRYVSQTALTAAHKTYLSQHPELRNLMTDYIQLILQRKPDDVFAFTKEYFSKDAAGPGRDQWAFF